MIPAEFLPAEHLQPMKGAFSLKVTFLSSKGYADRSANYGDCILIDNGQELVVYDCGSLQHAIRVASYMDRAGYRSAKFVLSHNDSDHFDGVPFLLRNNLISEVYALLLFTYVDDILALIDDGRRRRNRLFPQISGLYENIYSLHGKVPLKDIFENTSVARGVSIVGPDMDYSLAAVAKLLDSRDGDHVDGETIKNAVCTQLSVSCGLQNRLLLTGDSSFEAIKDNIRSHNAIQLPHHGKLAQAEDIFQIKGHHALYFVSDNTGASNGGSDDLRQAHPSGYNIRYTNRDGDLVCDSSSFAAAAPRSSYFRGFI